MDEKKFPVELENDFEKVREQVIWLHGRWIIYRQLFGTSEERVELLNASASTFFYFLQEVLMDDIQLTLSKLADPAKTHRNKNLSLKTLYEIINELGECDIHPELKEKLLAFQDKCKEFKKRRNKKLAHFDYYTLMNQTSKPLPKISHQMIEDALQKLRSFMNLIDGHFRGSEMAYDLFGMQNDGEALIHILKFGLRYEELIRSGKIDFDDLESSQFYQA